MSKSSEVVGGGTSASAAAAAPNVSAASAPIEKGGRGTTPEDAPLGREGSTSNKQPSA